MRARLPILLLPFAIWAAPLLPARAQTAPRQLNALPTVPDSVRQPQVRRRAVVAPPAAAPPVPAPSTDPPAPESGAPTRYSVGLKSGQSFRAYDVEIRQPVFGRSFLLLDGQQRFSLDEVKYYEDETGHYVRTTLPNSSREATLRRDKVGRISLYSALSSQYAGSYPGGGFSPYGYGGRYGGMGGFGGPVYRTVRTEYFTKDNGLVQSLNLKTLSLATADNPTSTALLLEAHRYQHYATASYVAAGALMVGGLIATLHPKPNGPAVSPLIYAAFPFLVVPIVVQSKQQHNMRQAISLYNRGL